MKLTEAQLKQACEDYEQALEFTFRVHKSDLERIDALNGVVEDFDKFFYEYVYVILASGFRAKVAARLCPLLVDCKGDLDKMREIFKNESKIKAIADVYQMKSKWKELRESFTSIDSLMQLPRIGPIVKYHLARNIGVCSCAKPDKHMVRWLEEITGSKDEDDVHVITDAIAKKVNKKEGTVDFALWVWLSHSRGEEMECCNGGLALR
ncbi:hypothetical protein TVAG_434340 [Trichomonas vaginalis G3]|uniref:HhH-GPD domain-containing protein n=1 Tax=Trichomonas vaginalis (strain ATCC PRA-98 / G3) TaxID=412133 RepID=A2DSL7_TRIV3|nr:hypothetical protein TVAGG3_0376400 [Trichomonas vaginalis G3]EAY16597.1 hypothetical protein TVAG_434340 [Trichomonas vaginalis G3]KAI5532975.1 hypothetical protein TVAGG3_0376400 [Trichomonas vaginalis G3]|eukprot:XP_001328820.1 hypothetical protein [Trichomonas vaginalis G3]